MPSFYIYTLGCKLNQLESEAVAAAFRRCGFAVLDKPLGADILVVNTCTVTSKAEQKARRVLRGLLRDHPRIPLIVTGCYAQLEGEALAELERSSGDPPGRLFVVPGDKKDALLDLPCLLSSGNGVEDIARAAARWALSLSGSSSPSGGRFRFVPDAFSFHSRGFLKIQDGCDRRCAYCRVSAARGPCVSVDAAEALAALVSLEERGAAEAVLTGVNIGQYRGRGPGGGEVSLAGLVGFLLSGTRAIRLRLSSLEPETVDGDLLRVLAHPRIRPHFHLSVQSGSPAILERMGRPYGPLEVEAAAARLRSVKDDPFLACDIIAGFPGETPAEFEKTAGLCERLRCAWIHAFPFSRRPGTKAWSYGQGICGKDARTRVDILTAMARRHRRDYAGRWINRDVEAVVEESEKNSRFLRVTSDNYLKLALPAEGEREKPGASLVCRITALAETAGALCGTAGFDGMAVKRV
ncbi:MAG: tRNA (N(6)-L-threonylcarbamoyladenosine(37)-C(2))-methylthiotransferase MtaB [Treponema sp.]|jgi:threonylcarbamoyladenosine tRNA methylthiotransferase MtaB|nr:tRNA (N(6)-L-threonylcarbamoyladenosine(37)-C(2))-methylthiotransferase MtaB [Treponema sp.]